MTGGGAGTEWDADTLAALRAIGHPRSFTRGQRIVFEGGRRSSVVLIESGAVKIVASSPDGDEVIVAVRRAGQLLGDLSALTDTPTGAAAIALGKVSATLIVGARYVEFLEARPKLLLEQFRRLVGLLRESDAKLLELATLDVAARVARRLLDLVGHDDDRSGLHLTEVSQEELAGMCGASREAVARVLKELRDQGIVSTERRRITVLDVDALRARA